MLTKAKVKYIQSLGYKKQRDEEAVFIAEGPKLISDLITSSANSIREIFAVNTWITAHSEMISTFDVTEISEDELTKISQLQHPNQVLAILNKFPEADLENVSRIVLALDDVQDPGNMGTIIRIADWFNITNIVCSDHCADIYNPKVVQASMGSIARVAITYTSLESFLKSSNLPVYAAMLNGQDVKDTGNIDCGVILIGNEGRGIAANLLPFINSAITIKRQGTAESLNAAVATGIILSHLTS